MKRQQALVFIATTLLSTLCVAEPDPVIANNNTVIMNTNDGRIIGQTKEFSKHLPPHSSTDKYNNKSIIAKENLIIKATGQGTIIVQTESGNIIYEANKEAIEKLGVTENALASFFTILQSENVPTVAWDIKLTEIGESFKESKEKLAEIEISDEALISLKEQAEEAIDRGQFEQAGKLLDQAAQLATDIYVENKLLFTAEIAASKGALASAQLKYLDMGEEYEKAATRVSQIGEGKFDEKWSEYLNLAGQGYDESGFYNRAEPLYEKALKIREKHVPPNYSNIVTSLNNLAGLYQKLGRYDESAPLYQRSLTISEKMLGKDPISMATTLSGLAGLYQTLGNYSMAELLYQRSLAILEKALGNGHPSVAKTLNDLSDLYQNQGRYEEAESLYKRSLAIAEKTLGKDHPSVAKLLSSLADLYLKQGRHEEVEPLYQRSLAISEKTLGRNHPSVAKVLNSLAELYREQGEYGKAEPLYLRSLAISEKVLGEDHPSIATSLNNLALLYTSQGRYDAAEPLYLRSLAMTEQTLGVDHPNAARILNNLAQFYVSQERYDIAETTFLLALSISENTLGKHHPSIAYTLNNLGGLYRIEGRNEEAEKFYKRSLEISQTALGKAHPLVVTTEGNLSELNQSLISEYIVLTLLAFSSAGVFYFRRYRHPLVLDLSDRPKKLLKLPLEQLPEARQRLQQTNRLEIVLSGASISPKALQNTLAFNEWTATKKAEYICQRVGGVLESELGVLKNSINFPLNIDKILLYFPTEAAEEVFQTLKTNQQTQNHITLIIGNDSAYQRKLYSTTRDTSNKWVAPQGSEITRLLLAPDAETALAEILAGQLSLQQISPYRIGGGVNNESVFFGRRELISQIINRDPANYLMVGGRQVGKSTLLKAIERRYADNPQVECVYLTLSSEVLVPRLASLLKLERTDDAEVLATQLDERIRESGQRFVFLIDEADRFIAQEKSHDYAILNVFRRLSEEGNCTFILAGFWQLYQHAVLDYQSPIRNFGELLSVGELEKFACAELVTQPMKTMNLSYANETLVEHIVDSCGQRANLIAIVCQHIVRNLPPQQRVIEAGDVAFALKSDEVRRALSGWVVGETDLEQAYERMVVYSTIGMSSFTTGELLAQAKEHDIAVDTLELDRTLSRLELSFVLGRKEGRWFYRVPLFVDYIAEDSPELKLQAELKRIVQQ